MARALHLPHSPPGALDAPPSLLAGLLDGASFEEERPGFLGGTNIVRREPIGVVGAIVPWNYPQTLAAFKYGRGTWTGAGSSSRPCSPTWTTPRRSRRRRSSGRCCP
ncbi:MAG: aldehyde dehydrogenase family protein [Streptosporangiaceae bacterium]